ncbi:MAG: carboxypeptidase regulatory-like domain-containing protein [Bacteroidota bacterium]
MRNAIGVLCLLVALTLAMPLALFAQGLTTAAINGVVTDQNGEVLPAANVVAVHVPSGTVYGISTRTDGHFNLLGLRAGGPYTITASLVGYRPQKEQNIELQLGQNFEINFKLVSEAVELGEINVTAERSAIISASRTGASTNVSKEAIERLPTVTRSFQDFERISPLFVGSSAAGRSNRFNNIQIDGANVNDLFGLGASGTPGGQANTNPISLDALQEFQIVIAPYDVRQGGFTGGGVNAITRSGTNQYTGSAYFYGRNQNQVGLGPTIPAKKVADFSDVQSGFRVGGPILQDKLFFFANGEITRRRAPSDVVLSAPGVAGPNVVRIPADTAARLASILRSRYGYDPGSFDALTARRQSNKIFARIDWNINEENRLTLRHNYVDAFDDNLQRTTASYYFENTNYVFNSTTNQTVLQLSSTLGTHFANELILGYTSIRDSRDYPGKAFPFVRINYDNNSSLVLGAGSENFSQANKLDQDIFEVTDNFTWFAGSNVFTFGTHNEFFNFTNLFIRNLFGYYEFPSVAAFDQNKPTDYQLSWSQVADPNWAAKFSALQWGLYGQVESQVLPNVKLTAGVRFDVPTLPDKPSYNKSVDSTFSGIGISTDKVPTGKVLWSPRLGFNWDIMGDKTTQVRGGVGVFTGRVPYVWVSNQYGNTGIELARLDVRDTNLIRGVFSPDPYNQRRTGFAPVTTSEIDVTDPNFKMPQLLRWNIGVDRQLPYGVIGTVEFIYSQTLNDVNYADVNLRLADSTTYYDGRPIFRGANRKINNAFTNVILMKNNSDGYQWNFTVQLQKPLSEGFFGSAAYTYGRSKDRNSVVSSQAYSQWRYNPVPGDPNNAPLAYSNYDRPHKVSIALSYQHAWFQINEIDAPTTITLAYGGFSGEPFSYTYIGDFNGDGETSNDLIFIPRDKSQINFKALPNATADQQWAALDAFIKSDDYLNTHRGQIMERNGSRNPWIGHLDLHVGQVLPILESHRVEITIDVLNFNNLLNKNWGRERYVVNQNLSLVKYEGIVNGQRTFSFTAPASGVAWQYNDLNSRWQAQLGLRYSF